MPLLGLRDSDPLKDEGDVAMLRTTIAYSYV